MFDEIGTQRMNPTDSDDPLTFQLSGEFISTYIRWIGTTFSSDIHGPQWMNLNELSGTIIRLKFQSVQ